MIGIYKITSPSGKIYIGQTVNIEKRFYKYKYIKSSVSQIKLHRSFLKYDINNHIFEIIEQCDMEQLNKRERYWQEFYNCIDNGLNCKYTKTNDKSGVLSDETKLKISLSNKGKKLSEEHINKLRGQSLSKEHKEKIRNSKLGNKHSKETCLKMSKQRKGFKHTEESKIKMSMSMRGIKKSKEHCVKIGLSKKSIVLTKEHKLKVSINSKQSKKVINIITNEIYNSIFEASQKLNINYRTLSYQLNDAKINKTNLIFLISHE